MTSAWARGSTQAEMGAVGAPTTVEERLTRLLEKPGKVRSGNIPKLHAFKIL